MKRLKTHFKCKKRQCKKQNGGLHMQRNGDVNACLVPRFVDSFFCDISRSSWLRPPKTSGAVATESTFSQMNFERKSL